MKRFLPLLISIIACFSCSSPESVVEKALREIGNGKYRCSITSVSVDKLDMNKKLFTRAYINSCIGEEFCKYGDLGRYGNLDLSKQLDIFFQTNILFDDIKFVDKEENTMDIYGFCKKDHGEKDKVMEDLYSAMEKVHSKKWKQFRSNVYGHGGIIHENVKCYELRYKVDNSRIARVLVLKLPDEGFRVGAVLFE